MLVISDVIRGYTDTIILAQLKKGDSYGYEINKTIQSITSNEFELKEATLYTAFRRLEDAGYIISYWGDETIGARRRYYTITDEGVKLYEENVQDWARFKVMIDDLL
ncbi:MAG TPA: helix-turn-helix transcriptional regulator [Epulopiscium sp.]|nr:helix-turn-helix transcriptional regulator [Candidatus Epulonipiscium sp.]